MNMTMEAARRYQEASQAEAAAWAAVEVAVNEDAIAIAWKSASDLQAKAHEARAALFRTVPETPAGAIEILRVIVDQLVIEADVIDGAILGGAGHIQFEVTARRALKILEAATAANA